MNDAFWGGFLVGAIAMAIVMVIGSWYIVQGYKENRKPLIPPGAKTPLMMLALLMVFLVINVVVSFAQETPVPLDIPINDIMESTNSWLTTFAPIAAIGIGISIALAVLGYLGKMIKSAFT